LAGKLIDALRDDPCILAIVVIVVLCFALIWYTFRHQERMEKIRVAQLSDLLKGPGQ
jgi:hypothetical protein